MGSGGVGQDSQRWFGERVRASRVALGLSQAELAERMREAGLAAHPTTVAKIEARDTDKPRSIKLDEAVVIAHILGTTVDQLVSSPQPVDAKQEFAAFFSQAVGFKGVVGERLDELSQRVQRSPLKPDPARGDLGENVFMESDDGVRFIALYFQLIQIFTVAKPFIASLSQFIELTEAEQAYVVAEVERMTAELGEDLQLSAATERASELMEQEGRRDEPAT